MALYGAESTAIADPALRKLRASIIKAADGRLSACRNPDAALEALAALEQEVGPAYVVCERRVLMLRRVVALHPAIRPALVETLEAYT
eukprot:3605482-Alexandrium_andersonii.AAC.1